MRPTLSSIAIWSILMNRRHLPWQGVKNKYWNITKSFGVHIVEGLGYVLVKLSRLNDKSVIMAIRRNWYTTHCVETRNPCFYIEEQSIQ